MTETEAASTASKTNGSSSSAADGTAEQPQKNGPMIRALSVVEVLGNKLPDPFWLFVILAGAVVALSAVLSGVGITAVNPADGEEVAVQNLLTPEGAQRMVGEAVENFATFPPLGVVITSKYGPPEPFVGHPSGIDASQPRRSPFTYAAWPRCWRQSPWMLISRCPAVTGGSHRWSTSRSCGTDCSSAARSGS